MTLFKSIRILLLLLILAAAAFYTKAQKLKAQSWTDPLEVVIFPINANNNPVVAEYIENLDDTVFASIDEFLQQQSEQYSIIALQPTITQLGTSIETLPPPQPTSESNIPEIIWWGLKFRFWAYRNTPDSASNLHRIRVFVHYHEPVEGQALQHSLGLDKGLLAIVHAFASEAQDEQNNIVITHELLHTVGATDKYNAKSNPVFPDGYANPEQEPMYPQDRAEIMTGRIPLSATHSEMAASLDNCVIGQQTALEINWLQ